MNRLARLIKPGYQSPTPSFSFLHLRSSLPLYNLVRVPLSSQLLHVIQQTQKRGTAQTQRKGFGLPPHAYGIQAVKEADLALAKEVKSLKRFVKREPPGRPDELQIFLCQRHAIVSYDMDYFNGQRQPMTDVSLWKHINRSKARPLWLYAIGHNNEGVKTKAIVRRKQESRVRKAFREALKMNGYDYYGRKIIRTRLDRSGQPDQSDQSDRSSQSGQRNATTMKKRLGRQDDPEQLYGFVQVKVNAIKLVQVPAQEMVDYFATVIDEVLKKELGCRAGEKPAIRGDPPPWTWRRVWKP